MLRYQVSTVAKEVATTQYYNKGVLAKGQNQHKQFNQAVATPSIPQIPVCSVSDTNIPILGLLLHRTIFGPFG